MRSIGIILKSDALARVITAAPFMTVINRDLPCIQRNTDRESSCRIISAEQYIRNRFRAVTPPASETGNPVPGSGVIRQGRLRSRSSIFHDTEREDRPYGPLFVFQSGTIPETQIPAGFPALRECVSVICRGSRYNRQ